MGKGDSNSNTYKYTYNLKCVKICARYPLQLSHCPTASLHHVFGLLLVPRGDITSWTCGPMPKKYTYMYKSNAL